MGYQPRAKSPRGPRHGYNGPLRERGKYKRKNDRKSVQEEQPIITEREITEATLRRLHVLGNQRFGSFPFSEHFDRWLTNVEIVLNEFKAHPTIGVDEEFINECTVTLAMIKRQLEDRCRKEGSVDQEVKGLSDYRSRLQKINSEFSTSTSSIRGQKSGEIRRLYRAIDELKKEQDRIIKVKTGFFRGISKKERERQETAITEQLVDKQNQLELAVLDLKAAQKKIRDAYEAKKDPITSEIKKYQKKIAELDSDGSLEERWFACEALIDAVNNFLQRKASKPSATESN